MTGSKQVAALRRASDAENAAIYAYSVLGSRLTDTSLTAAAAADTAHRDRRDAILELLAAAGATPRPAAVAYRLPGRITTPAAALALALAVETKIATVWRQTLADLTAAAKRPSDALAARTLAVDALADAAVRATGWRRLTTPGTPGTVPFPGS